MSLDNLVKALTNGKRKRGAYKKRTPHYKTRANALGLRRLTIQPQRYLANPVERRIVSQLKTQDQANGPFTVGLNTWRIIHLNPSIASGPFGENNRVSSKVVNEKLNIRMSIQTEDTDGTERWPIAESNNAWGLRLVIVEDRAPNGITIVAADVFEYMAGVKTINQFNNLGNRERFKIHEDRIINYVQGQNVPHMEEFYLRPNVVTQYDPNNPGGDISAQRTGAIYLLATGLPYASNPNTDAAIMFTCTMNTRIRFTDL